VLRGLPKELAAIPLTGRDICCFMGAERRNFPALRFCSDWQIYDIGEKIMEL